MSLHLLGQESSVQDKVTLKTGEVYVGKIILKTNEMVMITTTSGMRYQFVMSEIKNVESHQGVGDNSADSLSRIKPTPQGSFAAIADASVGMAVANSGFSWSPTMQLSLVVGNKSVFHKRFFVGVGLGYSVFFDQKAKNTIGFLPLFVRLQSTLTDKHTAPYVGIDAGYAFGLTNGTGGGEMLKVCVGLAHKISYTSVFSFGIYAGIQGYKAQLTETNHMGTFNYYGNATINSLGCKVALQF